MTTNEAVAHATEQVIIYRKSIILATNRVVIKKINGKLHPIRLLIDQGSELSLI